jgi:calmodulin
MQSLNIGDIVGAASQNKLEKKPKVKQQVPDGLSAEELKQAKSFFKRFDKDNNLCIDCWELCLAMQAMGTNPSKADLDQLMEQLVVRDDGKLEFTEFVLALQWQKNHERKNDAETDLLDAFVAMGGSSDKSGSVNAESLRKEIKETYGLLIKIDELLEDLDQNSDGQVSYTEFSSLFS